ncbi:Uncharacterised protein [Bordetella pertussis]|nr:Uncharacterised protein [Bordetella pertussis]
MGTTTTARTFACVCSASSSASIEMPRCGLVGISSARRPRLSRICSRPK